MRNEQAADSSRSPLDWLKLVYAGDIAGGTNSARPSVAARLLEESAGLAGKDPYLACAVGDQALLRRTISRDPGWIHRPGGPLDIPPLAAVTHSGLLQLPRFREHLRACARLLIESGADPNQGVGSRWTPASLSAPSMTSRLSPLYGAAGRNHDPDLTELLLQAGADPNDGESLYHSLGSIACTRLLLKAGARITGSNALYRVLDLNDIESLRLLLSSGADPNEPASSPPTQDWGTPLLWALRRRRSALHIQALLAAGADPSAKASDGASAYLLAMRFGLTDVARLLRRAGDGTDLPPTETLLAACARGDQEMARGLLGKHPGLISLLSEAQLRMLPELASQGGGDAVRLMVELGWPIATAGGDWNGSALNQAVFRGDAPLARFLLEHGASWTERHGYGGDVSGTLAWASLNKPVDDGDWLGCAEALVAHGMPAERDPQGADSVLVGGRRTWFSDEVADFLRATSKTNLESPEA